MEEKGKIIKINNSVAEIKIYKDENCVNCGLCSQKSNECKVKAANVIGAKVGDEVTVKVGSSRLDSKFVYLLIILPVLFSIIFAVFGYVIFKTELACLIGALIGFTSIIIFAITFNKALKTKKKYKAVIERISK